MCLGIWMFVCFWLWIWNRHSQTLYQMHLHSSWQCFAIIWNAWIVWRVRVKNTIQHISSSSIARPFVQCARSMGVMTVVHCSVRWLAKQFVSIRRHFSSRFLGCRFRSTIIFEWKSNAKCCTSTHRCLVHEHLEDSMNVLCTTETMFVVNRNKNRMRWRKTNHKSHQEYFIDGFNATVLRCPFSNTGIYRDTLKLKTPFKCKSTNSFLYSIFRIDLNKLWNWRRHFRF